MNESRIYRIARGSGTSVMEVNQLIEEHKRLKVIVEKMGKSKFGKSNNM